MIAWIVNEISKDDLSKYIHAQHKEIYFEQNQ